MGFWRVTLRASPHYSALLALGDEPQFFYLQIFPRNPSVLTIFIRAEKIIFLISLKKKLFDKKKKNFRAHHLGY